MGERIDELESITRSQSRESEHLHREYYEIFIKTYNENPLSAFSTFVSIRDESKRRLIEKENDLKKRIHEFIKELERFFLDDSLEELVFEIEDLLKGQLKKLNFNLYKDIISLVDMEVSNDARISNKLSTDYSYDIDEILGESRTLNRIRVIIYVTSFLIDKILDNGFPYEISTDLNTVAIEVFKVEIPIEKPDKLQKYLWYEKFYQETENVVESFNLLIKKIEDLGMLPSDFDITTTDPMNFKRSYTKWFTSRN